MAINKFRRRVVFSVIEDNAVTSTVWRNLECGHAVAESSAQISGITLLPKPAKYRHCTQCRLEYLKNRNFEYVRQIADKRNSQVDTLA